MNTGQCMQTDVFYIINRFVPSPHTSVHDGGTPTRAVTMASRACTTQKHASGSCVKQILMSTLTNHVLM